MKCPTLSFLALLFSLVGFVTETVAQDAHRLVIEVISVSPPDATGDRMAEIRLRVADARGAAITNTNFVAPIRARIREDAGIVISEISGDGTEIELTHVGSVPVSMEGWILEARRGFADGREASGHVILGPATLAPGGVVVWSSRINASDLFPRVRHPEPFPYPFPTMLEVRTATGRLVDQVSILGTGSPTSPFRLGGGNLRLLGSMNHHLVQDPVGGPTSMGMVNPGLVLPWVGLRQAVPTAPESIQVIGGIGHGMIRVSLGSARHWQFGAVTPDGLIWETPVLSLPEAAPLTFELVDGSLVANESNPGRSALAKVVVPGTLPLGTDLALALKLDVAGEFEVPSTVVVPAGAMSAEFEIHNLDDAVADGRALVTLTASAAGFGSATWTLIQDDNEVGSMFVTLPGPAVEGAGVLSTFGNVSLPSPALHDTEIRLASVGRVWTPTHTVIPKGAVSAHFPVRILDDRFANVPPTTDQVTASMPGWPVATGRIEIIDDEHPGFSMELDEWIHEGTPTEGRLLFANPPDRPLSIRLSIAGIEIRVPREVVLPAGETSVTFPVESPDDEVLGPQFGFELCVGTDRFGLPCRMLMRRDNDAPADRVWILGPEVVLGNDAVLIRVVLEDSRGWPKQTNGMAQVRIKSAIGDVRVDPGFSQVPLVDGRFDGFIRLSGYGIQTVLEVEFGGFVGHSPPFDMVMGRGPIPGVADVSEWPGRTNLLALLVRTNAMGPMALVAELDPASGQIVQTLELPAVANRIAVADSGSVAWLASETDTVQRIDLEAWQHAGSIRLDEVPGVRRAIQLAVSPGTTEDVLILSGPIENQGNVPHRWIGIRDGLRMSSFLEKESELLQPSVVPGRTSGEFYSTLARRAYRIRMGEDRLEWVQERDLTSLWPGFVRQPVIVGSNLVFSGGNVVDADTLADVGEYQQRFFGQLWTATLAYPDEGLVLFASDGGYLESNLLEARTAADRFQIPLNPGSQLIDQMVRWGRRGAGLLSSTTRQLFLVDAAVRPVPTADLSISLAIPDRVPWPDGTFRPGWVPAILTITNRGPGIAWNGVYAIPGHESGVFEPLAPGGSVVLHRQLDPGVVGERAFTATVGASTADPDPSNNLARAATWVEPLEVPGEGIARIRGRHLVARPDGTELWLVTGPESGFEGVVVLDPVSGDQIRTIAVGPDPRRIVPLTDNSGFLVQLGDTRVVRWNLAAGGIDFDQILAGGPVIDIAALPLPSERIAVLLRGRIVVFEGTNQIQSVIVAPSSARALAVGGGQLWAAREGELLIYNLVPAGLGLVQTAIASLSTPDPRFHTDGTWAAFDGRILEPATGRSAGTIVGGVPLVPSGDGSFFGVNGHRLRRYTAPYLELAAEVVVRGLVGAGSVLDVVRWGRDGFAFRTDTGIVVTGRSLLIPEGVADLGVALEPVTPTYRGQPSRFHAVVTNRGPDTVRSGEVVVYPSRTDSITANPPAFPDGIMLRLPFEGLGAGEARAISFTVVPGALGWSDGTVQLFAAVQGSFTDPDSRDNQIQTAFPGQLVRADLGLRFEVPVAPRVGEAFDIFCIVTNAGPGSVVNPILYLPETALQWMDPDQDVPLPFGTGDRIIPSFTPSLDPGTEVRVRLRARAHRPGVYPLRAFLNLAVEDSAPRDNLAWTSIRIDSPTGSVTYPEFDLPYSAGRWSPTRNQWILSDSFSMTFLEPDTLEVQGGFRFPYQISEYLQNQEGTHIWIPGEYPGFDRINLDTGEVDLRIPPEANPAHSNGTIATVPGRPEVLVLYGLLPNAKPEASVTVGGIRLPDTYSDDLAWQGSGLVAGAASDGRIFLSNGAQLRELELTPTGLRFVRNLDAYQRHTSLPIVVSNGLLVQGMEEALDLDSLELLPFGNLYRPIFDSLTFRQRRVIDGASRFEMFDLTRRLPVWTGPNRLPEGAILGAGIRGALALGAHGGRIRPPTNTAVDLQMRLTGNVSVPGVGHEFVVPIQLRQFGSWIAGPVRISAELSPGVEWLDPAVQGAPPTYPFTFINPSADLVFRFRAAAPGPIRIRLEADADAIDPTPEDARLDLDLVVPPAPVVLLNDLIVHDNGRPFVLRLSQPAPQDLSVTLRAEPVSIQDNDIHGSTVEVPFAKGTRQANVYWVVEDLFVEEDEQFFISVAPGGIASTAHRALVTIRNDDRANFRLRNETRPEGNSNAPPVNLQISIDAPIETSVEISFATLSGTALADDDFLAARGRLLFTPTVRTNIVRIPVLGDMLYEADEVFSVQWSDPDGAFLPLANTTITLRNDDPPPGAFLTYDHGTDGAAIIRFQSVNGVRYTLQSRELFNVGNWGSEGQILVGNGGMMVFRPQPRSRNTWYYRVIAN